MFGIFVEKSPYSSESDDIVQACIGFTNIYNNYNDDYIILCVTTNSYSNNDLEEQCNSVQHLYSEGLSELSSTFYSDSIRYSCNISTKNSMGVGDGFYSCSINSNGNASCDSGDVDICEISSSGVASCYLD